MKSIIVFSYKMVILSLKNLEKKLKELKMKIWGWLKFMTEEKVQTLMN